jgi:hypothetical protein
MTEQKAPMEYEHDGRWWRLWYRRGDILYLKRSAGLNRQETCAVDLWLESQKKFPNVTLINAADEAPVESEDEQ